jgi:hypothetical protein
MAALPAKKSSNEIKCCIKTQFIIALVLVWRKKNGFE